MALRPLVWRALAALRADSVGLLLRRRRTLILAYHNVIPDDLELEPLGSHHMRVSEFQRQIAWIAQNFDIVPLPEALEARDPGHSLPRAAVTFDDAYRGALELAVPWLAANSIPSTVFVAPGCLGLAGFWWDRLPMFPWDDFELFFQQLRGEQDLILDWARREDVAVRSLPSALRPGSEGDLSVMVSHANGHVLMGPHGWNHENLAALPPEDLDVALTRPLAWLRERFPRECSTVLAYPYGISSERVRKGAEATGHQAGLLIDGGWVPRLKCTPFEVPRRNVPSGMSPDVFRMLLPR